MVSQRQREARKKFKQEHPELFPKKEQNPTSDTGEVKKKKKPKFKRKKPGTKGPKTLGTDSKKSAVKRHPLRVPGLKPGDGCFICKAKNHVAKLCPEKDQWERNKTCLLCRQRGHTLKRCPNNGDESLEKKICYNCGEYGHSLFDCTLPKQDGGTKFASCFICNEQGHLSKDCPKNTRGVYPKGGCCKLCGGVNHLAKDCPEKGQRAYGAGRPKEYVDATPRGKVTKLVSGDDLEDDFMMGDHQPVGKEKPSKSTESTKDVKVKSKTKQGVKVVNFTG